MDARTSRSASRIGEPRGHEALVNGVVVIYSGSAAGLHTTSATFVYPGSKGVAGDNEHGDYFGATLAVGGFDDDERDDLVIGVPGETYALDTSDPGSNNYHDGIVQVLFGGATFISGRDDVAIGLEERVAGKDAGGVVVVYPTSERFQDLSAQRWTEQSISAMPEDGDNFGCILR
jgi:hypothetical protein